jgi:hypothetical protein
MKTPTVNRSLGESPTLLACSVPMDAKLRAAFANIFPTVITTAFMQEPSPEDIARADVIYGFLPKTLQSTKQAPKLKLVQLMSAGSDLALHSAMWKEKEAEAIGLATSSGVHVGSIPQVTKLFAKTHITTNVRLRSTSLQRSSLCTIACSTSSSSVRLVTKSHAEVLLLLTNI